MGFYDRTILPRAVDLALRGDEINALRARSLAGARGRVLEVGFGTGLNARHYPKDVEKLVVIDDNAGMSALAKERLDAAGLAAEHAVLSGESLPFSEQSFDTVVVTFTLCSIPDVDRAVREMSRVLAKDGRLLFLEHNRADDAGALRWQERLSRAWRFFGGGCELLRDAPSILERNGFALSELEKAQLSTSPVFGTIRRGVAVPA